MILDGMDTAQFARARRNPDDPYELALILQNQLFFAGVGLAVLQEISSILSFYQASPGEAVLHVGELTDRLFLLLSGSCSLVRHSRREGFQPQPPQQLLPGQTLCEASLVVASRRSDVAVTVAVTQAASAHEGGGIDGGALFAVFMRSAWSSLSARAPLQPLCAQARTALLCCCARSLASNDPGVRTLEQAEDLAALLRLLPSLSITPEPVLRAMSESVVLRQLPPGTILFEESTRAESEFVVLAGAVEVRRRPRRRSTTGGAGRSSGSGGTTSTAAATSPSAPSGASSASRRARFSVAASAIVVEDGPNKSVKAKIEDERRAREALKESLALTRDGLREAYPATPPQVVASPTQLVNVSKQWMSEFVDRARKAPPGSWGADEMSAEKRYGAVAFAYVSGHNRDVISSGGNLSRAARAWRHAMLGLSMPPTEDGDDEDFLDDKSDLLLAEYERLKKEAAGQVTDVGNLLGGAGARGAYLRGIQESRRVYGYERHVNQEVAEHEDTGSAQDAGDGGKDQAKVAPRIDIAVPEPLIRMRLLDRNFQLAIKGVRFQEAAEQLARLVEERGWDIKSYQQSEAVSFEPTIHSVPPAGGSSADLAPASAIPSAAGTGSSHTCSRRDSIPGSCGEALLTDPSTAQLAQLYGPSISSLGPGQLAGELPETALCQAAGLPSGGSNVDPAGPMVPLRHLRRADTAIAGPSGADVLVVALEALRRGHDAARDDLVSERLAVLASLEPLRGLSDEHQSQLALGCTVISLDANQFIVRQGELVDALYVVLEGEVRLLNDPTEVHAAALSSTPLPTASSPATTASTAGGIPSRFAASGRSISLNSTTASRKSAAQAAAADAMPSVLPAAVAPPQPPSTQPPPASGTGGHGSLRVRRAVAVLGVLSLLGPGGSFGESVLGYPEDLEAEVTAGATAGLEALQGADSSSGDGGGGSGSGTADYDVDGGGGGGPSDRDRSSGSGNNGSSFGFALAANSVQSSRKALLSSISGVRRAPQAAEPGSAGASTPTPAAISHFLASAVTARLSRLLVLPRSLLIRYGYLRSSLPPFAHMRREAVEGRRKQLKAGLQALPGVALGLAPPPPPPPPAPLLLALGSSSSSAPPGPVSPPTCDRGRGALAKFPSMPAARAVSLQRPLEYLEQAGLKGMSNARTTAVLGGIHSGTAGGLLRGCDGSGSLEQLSRFANSVASNTLRQFLESSDGGLLDDHPRSATGTVTSPGLRKPQLLPLLEVGEGEAGLDADIATEGPAVEGGQTANTDASGAGAGGWDALNALPRPCAMRTSLSSSRLYGTMVTRQSTASTRVTISGLPLIPTLTASCAESGACGPATPGSAGTGGRDMPLSPSGGDSNGSLSLSRRTLFPNPPLLKVDSVPANDGDAATAVDSPSSRSTVLTAVQSPPAPPQTPPPTIIHTPTAATSADLSSSVGSHTPRIAWDTSLATGNMKAVSSPSGSLPSSSSTAPRECGSASMLLMGSAAASDGGGSGACSNFHMRASYTSMPRLNSSTSMGPSAIQQRSVNMRWDRMMESAPGTSTFSPVTTSLSPQYQSQRQLRARYQSHPQLIPTALSAGWPGVGISPHRQRLRGPSGAVPRASSVSQLEFPIGAASLVDTSNTTLAPPPPQLTRAFGLFGSISSRNLCRGEGGTMVSWDGETAGDGGRRVIGRGGMEAVTALALATLAANHPSEVSYLLVP